MPYNTRRKSLSLPSLGIHLPSRSNRSPSVPKVPSATEIQPPPPKKAKRSHSGSQSPVAASSRAEISARKSVSSSLKGRRGADVLEHTPPPSPADSGHANKIDTEGISDDIVVAVIEQLEKTGNRPHLIKELATVLAATNESVANSANAAALLSSRLSLYLKRPWTALSPCPIAKELIPIHPRKVFFYLTTSPHQPLPDSSDDIITPTTEVKQITPSLSSGSVDQDDADELFARERDMSPEVDLSPPEFDDELDSNDLNGHAGTRGPHARGSNFGSQNNLSLHNHRLSHNHRSASPPLEGDEKEFTQTATSVRERTSSEELAARRRRDMEKSETGQKNDSDEAVSTGNTAEVQEQEQVNDQSQSNSQDGYMDYFTVPIHHDQDQDINTAAALFGTSPSPSAVSEMSSLSSATSVTSDGEMDDESNVPKGMLMGEAAPAGLVHTGMDAPTTLSSDIALRTARKRSISIVEAESGEAQLDWFGNNDDLKASAGVPPADSTMMDKAPTLLSLSFGSFMSLDATMESWNDLRSPETVELEELDEIFADI
ncbi:hypothetical protein AJ80_02580 [Polytolypa hystricis UAMH7299]|uniref:GDS1 winged helix domain-containing protein n=1 Tax=Polytolypa hystricis (strain UAMH7299) TaxID=1447883 RepID=A0A2B7YR16_POLH7|nr:hypothetical protein AJ80_02580 [Polytolypa hystricis UAMH7299]